MASKDNRAVYEIEIHGQKRTFLMSEEDAEKYKGAVKLPAAKPVPANKAVTAPANK